MAHCLRCNKTCSEFWLCDTCFGQDRAIAAKARGWQVEATRILEDYLADKDTLTLHFDRMEALVASIANADLGGE